MKLYLLHNNFKILTYCPRFISFPTTNKKERKNILRKFAYKKKIKMRMQITFFYYFTFLNNTEKPNKKRI